jgi:alpha-beta hydrolase superfamily lysophospholipase
MAEMIKDQSAGILYKKWDVNSPDTVFLLIHGLGAHSGRWDFLGEYFQGKNIASYSIELKGFGKTKDLKGHIDSLNIYIKDVLSLYKIIKKEHPAKKVYLLGESMGALIAFLIAMNYGEFFDGLICISPAFANKMKFPAGQMVKMILSLPFIPKKQFTVPFNSQMVTRDKEYQKVMDSNPDEHRLATSKLLIEIVLAQFACMMGAGRIGIPLLFLLAGDDKDLLVDPVAAKKVFKKLKIDDKKMIQYPDMLHALSIELGREKVFEDIYKWVKGEG